jgi:D-alanyl-D-alanine carboxypeptidase (penicillin-binding protein 5/6)
MIFLVAFTMVSLTGGDFVIYAAAPPALDAETAVLMDQRTGQILYAKDGDKQMYPASTTKILTALVAVEQGDLDEVITVGNEVLHIPIDSSKAGLSVGDTISLRELIYGLMLPSGNDAAYTIAVHFGRRRLGDPRAGVQEAVAAFAELMNQRARELGAVATQFTVPDGYHRAEHYTTARDLALIARAALEHPFIREVAATGRYVPEAWTGPHVRPWGNTNQLVRPYQFGYQYATGLKTGYTGQAGFCMVGSAARGDLELIAVVLNTSKDGRWLDTTALLEYGFENFAWQQLVEADQVLATVKVSGQDVHEPETIDLTAAQGFGSTFPLAGIPRIEKDVIVFPKSPGQSPGGAAAADSRTVSAPLEKGQVLGEVVFSLDGRELFRTELLATQAVAAMPWWRKALLPGGLSLGLGLTVLLLIKQRRRRRRRRFVFQGGTRRIGL